MAVGVRLEASLTVVLLVPLVWRRRAPVAVAGVVPVVQFAQLLSATAVVGAVLAGCLRRIVRVRDEAEVERSRRPEVERDAAVAVAAEHERRRIARDLHDVVAHSLTVVVAPWLTLLGLATVVGAVAVGASPWPADRASRVAPASALGAAA